MTADYDSVPGIGLLYDSVPLYGARLDPAFYAGEASRAGGPVLELGCGTGRILLPIARAGGTITGLDSSAPMLARLRERLAAEPAEVRARVTLHQGDARDFSLGRRYRLITAPFRVMQHLTTIADQLGLLGAVARHLEPGGRFVFDVFNPDFRRLTQDRTAEAEDTPEFALPDGRILRRTARITRVRWVEQINDTEIIYYVRAKPGAEPTRHVQAFPMRWYTRGELEHLLARAGFWTVAVYGDLNRGPLRDDSPDQLWIAERAPA